MAVYSITSYAYAQESSPSEDVRLLRYSCTTFRTLIRRTVRSRSYRSSRDTHKARIGGSAICTAPREREAARPTFTLAHLLESSCSGTRVACAGWCY